MSTATSISKSHRPTSQHQPRAGFKRALFVAKAFWLAFVPGLLATLAVWVLADTPADSILVGQLEGWLRDQALLVWLGVFVLVSSLLRYWRSYLRPPLGASTAEEPPSLRAAPASRTGLSYLVTILVAGASALVGRSLIGEPCKVRTSSMVPTLYPADQLLVSKLSRSRSRLAKQPLPPQRGSVILFATPDPALREIDSQLFKRVVGLPGDVLSIQGGAVVINGWKIPRCSVGRVSLRLANMDAPLGGFLSVERLGDATYLTLAEGLAVEANQGPYVVEPGEVWVLGDNRNNSSDSRSWFGGKGGGVPFADVIGSPVWAFFNASRKPSVQFTRVESATLPPGAEQLKPAFDRCLAERPKSVLPPDHVEADRHGS